MSNGKTNPFAKLPNSRPVQTNQSSSKALFGAMSVHIEMIKPNPNQVRRIFDEERLQELSDDIKAHGILEPLVVREIAGEYVIVAGERRYRAAKLAGLVEIPVIVREMSDKDAQLVNLIENVQREDLDPDDEQRFYIELQNQYNYSITEIAKLVHKSRPYVSQKLKLIQNAKEENINNQISDDEATVSDKIHETSGDYVSLQKSQSGAEQLETPKLSHFRLKQFGKPLKVFDQALNFLSSEAAIELNAKDKEDLLASVEEMEQKLLAIRQHLRR